MFNILRYEVGMGERELRLHRAMLIEDRNKFALLENLYTKLKRILKSEEKVEDLIRELITLVSEERREIVLGIKDLQKEIEDEKKGLVRVAEKFDKTNIRLDERIRENLIRQIRELKYISKSVKGFPEIESEVKELLRLCGKQLRQDKMLLAFDFKLLRILEKQKV